MTTQSEGPPGGSLTVLETYLLACRMQPYWREMRREVKGLANRSITEWLTGGARLSTEIAEGVEDWIARKEAAQSKGEAA